MSQHTKVAIVTGAGTGVGRATALALLRDGYRVVLAGRRPEPLAQVVAEAGPAASRALAIPTDVSDPESVRLLFARTKEAFGRLDLLFNNAGISLPVTLPGDFDPAAWRRAGSRDPRSRGISDAPLPAPARSGVPRSGAETGYRRA